MLMRQCSNFLAWPTRPFEIGPQALRLALAPATFYPAAAPDVLFPLLQVRDKANQGHISEFQGLLFYFL